MRRALLACLLLCGCSRNAPPAPTPAGQAAAAPAVDPARRERELAACCRQCLAASERDPAGMDLAPVSCSRYLGEWNGAAGVSAPCATLLDESKATVGSCRRR